MKSLIVFSAVCIAVLSASAAIEVQVCDPNALRPLGTHEVMLGTQVSLVVYSDANDLWSGGLFIHDEHRGTGRLSSRDSDDPNIPSGGASCLEAAGQRTFIMPWNDSLMSGFDMYTDEFGRNPGNWFVLDYIPLAEGECKVYFYDHKYSFTAADPNMQITLLNSPTRDWDSSGVVGLADWAVFASMWESQGCAAPDWCGGTDLDRDGTVGLVDLAMFSDFWLWGSPNWQRPIEKPVLPAVPQDPNVFYAIIDPNGMSEASIPVGQSIRLYLHKTTLDESVYIFSLEVTNSDPNLGWIDNTAYDPNNPPGYGSAELLATPRCEFFDYWGPGYTQEEGIQFLAASIYEPIYDGLIASFVYTPAAEGTVTLELVNYLDSASAELFSIVLHQYDPYEQMAMSSDTTMSSESIEEIVQTLEEIWEETPEVRETIEEERWIEFIEAVKASAESETLE